MSRSPSPSQVAAAKIPKITDLRERLAYGDNRLSRCAAFIDDLRVFRRRYSVAGFHGTDLWDWKSSEQQDALRKMTLSFLEHDGYGELYWPSDPTAANFNSLQYSTDRTFITRLMRQLIFRLNLQQYRNNKYKKKEFRQVPEIIDLEDDGLGVVVDQFESNRETASISPGLTTTTHVEIRSSEKAVVPISDPIYQGSDVYDVPTSPEYTDHTPQPSIAKRKLKAPSRSNPARRSKIVRLKTGAGKRLSPHNRRIAPMPQRTSPRGRRKLPDYSDLVAFEQPFTSPTSMTESTTGSNRNVSLPVHSPSDMRRTSEMDGDFLSSMMGDRTCVINDCMSSAPVNQTRRETIDSNIDPNLEQISSQAFSANTQQKLHQTGTSSHHPLESRIPPSNSSPEPTLVLSPTRTMSATGSTYGIQQATASFHPSSTPSDANKTHIQLPELYSASITKPEQVSSTDSKAGISFNYWVILSRVPIYQAKTWHPTGHFLEKSLSELIHELPFENKDRIVGLVIQLTSAGAALEVTAKRGQEANYTSAKAELTRVAKMCLKSHVKAKTGSELVVDIRIEAVREDGVDEDESEDDDVLLF